MHCEKKQVCLLLDFGVVNRPTTEVYTLFTTVDIIDGETTICSVEISCGLTPK